MICPSDRCTGCAACYNVCPQACINMIADDEGFLYPHIDQTRCSECGACMNICPMIHLPEPNQAASPLVYACWNRNDDIRFHSTSGGVFSALSQYVLDEHGVVFGAAYDENMRVVHVAVQCVEDLQRLRGSKYVQSDIGSTYQAVRGFLAEGRMVLFSGTPCQVAALDAFVGDDKELLMTCDVLCKGVPSPGLFSKYISFIEHRFGTQITGLNFRHKKLGWLAASTVAELTSTRERVLVNRDDSFMSGFQRGLILRPACYQCRYAMVTRHGDISLGDFWGLGITKPFSHSIRNGVSLILVNSEKGQGMLQRCKIFLHFEERDLAEALGGQGTSLSRPVHEPAERVHFFADYHRADYAVLAKRYLVDKGIRSLLKHFIPRSLRARLRVIVRQFRR